MLGLTFEKLLVVGLIAAVVIGPRRLPTAVAGVASLVRGLRRTVDAARLRAATELGVPADTASWRALDPRQYDPRRIIAEALAAPPTAVGRGAAPGESRLPAAGGDDEALPAAAHAADPDRGAEDAPSVVVRRIRTGDAAHPRWIEVRDEAATRVRETDEAVTGRSTPSSPVPGDGREPLRDADRPLSTPADVGAATGRTPLRRTA